MQKGILREWHLNLVAGARGPSGQVALYGAMGPQKLCSILSVLI